MSNPATINIQRISLGQLKTQQDVAQLVKHLSTLYNTTIPVITGSGAPTMAPTKISGQYIDVANKQVYVATGINGHSDWVKVS